MINNELSQSLLIPKNAKQFFISGPVGKLDCLLIVPNNLDNIEGIAIIFHPNPIGGGNYTNKIVQTIAKTLNLCNFICICPNLRGVGKSDGIHDYGNSEIADASAIYDYITTDNNLSQYLNINNKPSLILAGFSFGTAIASALAQIVPYKSLLLVGPAVTKFKVLVPDNKKTIVIHGSEDEIIPINDVFNWAKRYQQNIIWVPNVGHFFHGKLPILQEIILQYALSKKNI